MHLLLRYLQAYFIAHKSFYSLNIPLKDKFMPCKSLDKISEALDYLILSDTSFS